MSIKTSHPDYCPTEEHLKIAIAAYFYNINISQQNILFVLIVLYTTVLTKLDVSCIFIQMYNLIIKIGSNSTLFSVENHLHRYILSHLMYFDSELHP